MNRLQQLYCRFRYVLEKEMRKRYPRMQDTLHIPAPNTTRMIAHRGVSGLETENTIAAFIAAGKRSYYGIETDVHRTKDGQFVVFHDDDLKRMANKNLVVEQTDFEVLRTLKLLETRFYKPQKGIPSAHIIPTLLEYIEICKQYDKTAVLELKNHFEKQDIFRICEQIKTAGWLDRTTFISFDFDNLTYIREYCPTQTVQFLTGEIQDTNGLLDKLEAHRFDWDAYHRTVNKQLVDECHQRGIRVNVWTVDELPDAQKLIEYGVDYITSDILE